MNGQIINFRGGVHTQKGNHMIIKAEGVENREEAEKLIDKKVTWKSPAGKELNGRVASAHGNNGCVRVIFETGMPGQSLSEMVVFA